MFTRSVTVKRLASSAVFKRTKITLPELKWDFDALEPYVSGKINELHYTKHHQTYVNGFNSSIDQFKDVTEKLAKDPNSLELANKLIAIQQNIKFHGGGYKNHCLFWENLSPASGSGVGGELPTGNLLKQIEKQYKSLDNLIKLANAKLMGIQGSGWIFLVKNLNNGGKLDIVQTYNQDTVSDPTIVPLLAIDAWEHAYYLQYENRKAEYFGAIWNVINWKEAEKRFNAA
ncbi:hypothetical protein TPHA_0D02730 [Tetrapisispora phaffii CBS 4417]|uniref:Superoxide dismutase n=1 Tax=Tetrapisispora phaffii (strain ATCC 24235 / CBS 4417 / NBRC 1672 / NRRL Y-8282 / UCD 70-5) TaxID=1071381 RepID=G8BST8_TETPH|nr:hypothetical protein TPHA_0D02730 [Tetrapisispora phaffii CBS 4417]CCE62909.1 hypothetical protein TPHA_0D02730 [Tetrapisispora phaffii CBS 4417]